MRNKLFIFQIWNGRSLYLCLFVPHGEYVDKRRVFEADNLWLPGIIHLIFLAFGSVKGEKNSEKLLFKAILASLEIQKLQVSHRMAEEGICFSHK